MLHAHRPASPPRTDAGSVGDRTAAPFEAAWAAYAARTGRGRRRLAAVRAVREGLQVVVTALALFFVSTAAVQGYEVEGPSMQPGYRAGQRVFVNKLVYRRWQGLSNLAPALFHPPARGETVVFDPPFTSEVALIKRVIGVPGDHVVIRDGRVFINGQPLSEAYLPAQERTDCGGQWCDVWLGQDDYFVLGDNRPNSSDSRSWGTVRLGQITGKAWFVFSPFREFGHAP